MQTQIEEKDVWMYHYVCKLCPLPCDLYRRCTGTERPPRSIMGAMDAFPCSQVFFELQIE